MEAQFPQEIVLVGFGLPSCVGQCTDGYGLLVCITPIVNIKYDHITHVY